MKNTSDILDTHKLFDSMDHAEKELVLPFISMKTFKQDETIIEDERTGNKLLYIITKGKVKVIKKVSDSEEYVINTLSKNDIFGEMVLFKQESRTAKIKASTNLEIVAVDLTQLIEDQNYLSLYNKLIINASFVIRDRLINSNKQTINYIKEQLLLKEYQILFGSFITTVLFLLSLYTLSLDFFKNNFWYQKSALPSIIVLTTFLVANVIFMYRNNIKINTYGLEFVNFRKKITHALIYAIPVLISIVIVKIFLLYANDMPIIDGLFTPSAQFIKNDEVFSLSRYLIYMLLYSIFVIIQELVVRGTIQTTLINFLINRNPWVSIIISNCMFAAIHSHKSFGYAMFAFISGCYWGWLYVKEKNLITVSINHIIIGNFFAFIVGFQHLI